MARQKVDWHTLEGYERYQAYLKSDDWKEIKALVRERDKVCRCCGRTEDQAAMSVHHSTYVNLFNEKEHLDDLILLCQYCHSGIHRVKSNIHRFRKPKK